MALQVINIGASPNDGTGDPIRTAYTKCNNNFATLDSRYQTTVPASSIGQNGDVAGMYAVNGSYLYYCIGSYDGSTQIWRRISGSSF